MQVDFCQPPVAVASDPVEPPSCSDDEESKML